MDYVLKIDSKTFDLYSTNNIFLFGCLFIKNCSQYLNKISEIIIENHNNINEDVLSYLFNECKNLKSLKIINCENFPKNALNILDNAVDINIE